MKYLWCVCDLDGTLLNSQNKISQKDERMLAMLTEAGICLILATGRSNLMIGEYIHQLKINTPIIACNGGIIVHPDGGIVYKKYIDDKLAIKIIKYCEEMKYEYLVYTNDMVYQSYKNRRIEIFKRYNRSTRKEFVIPISEIDELRKNSISENIIKILLSDADKHILQEVESVFNYNGQLSMVSSNSGLVDIMAPNTTKGEALKYLAEKMKIDLSRTVAFGDNYNDLAMFKVCGLPIAMENAEEEVKRLAKYVTLSNEQSGVAYALRQKVLGITK